MAHELHRIASGGVTATVTAIAVATVGDASTDVELVRFVNFNEPTAAVYSRLLSR